MKRRLSAIVLVLGLVLICIVHGANSWVHFAWPVFWSELRHVRFSLALLSILLIYVGYTLRALRWKLLIASRCQTTVGRLLPATVLGFTGLALLGRPGELIRPYLIARKEGLTLSSQLGVWAVERIFDSAAFTSLALVVLLLSPSLNGLPYFRQIRLGVLVVAVIAMCAAIAVLGLVRNHSYLGGRAERALMPISRKIGSRVAQIIGKVAESLSAVPNFGTLLKAGALSLAMWLVIALAYFLVIHAFGPPLNTFSLPKVMILMTLSLLTSLVQLPGGSGHQLAVMVGLTTVFSVPAEMAVSCGILAWLCTSLAPVPVGLALLRRSGLSLQELSVRSRKERGTEVGIAARP